MGRPGQEHDPLIGGIRFKSGQFRADGSEEFDNGNGTLTGVARNRYDPNIRYLVGCNHSMAKGLRSDPYSDPPSGKIFQPSFTPADEVGTVTNYHPVRTGIVNEVDVAIGTINPGKTGAFLVNDHPHGSMKVIAGTVTPGVGDSLVVMGAVSGKVVLDVVGVNETTRISFPLTFWSGTRRRRGRTLTWPPACWWTGSTATTSRRLWCPTTLTSLRRCATSATIWGFTSRSSIRTPGTRAPGNWQTPRHTSDASGRATSDEACSPTR